MNQERKRAGEPGSEAQSRGRRLAGMGFLVPAVAVGASVALAVSGYTPLTFDTTAAASASQAQATELKTVDTADAERQAEPAAASSGDYGIDLSGAKDGIYTGSGTGFSGVITVRVTIQGGRIVSIDIVSSGDDESYFGRVRGLTSAVISAQSTNVDTVSGATYSSRGLLMAIKNALLQATGGTPEQVDASGAGSVGPVKQLTKADTVAPPAGGYADGEWYGTGEGFGGELKVRVVVAGGQITDISVVESNDTVDYFARAWNAITPAVKARQGTDVDSVSGATYSSEGIKEAISNALRQSAAAAGNVTPAPDPAPGPDPEPTPDPDPSPNPDPDDPDAEDKAPKYEDGDYTGYALCQNAEDEEAFTPYYVAVGITVQDGKPKINGEQVFGTNTATGTDLPDLLDPFDEDNEPYLSNAMNGRTFRGVVYKGVLEQLGAGTDPEKVDVVTRATYSSKAIAKAYEEALELAHKAYLKAHPEENPDSGEKPGQEPGEGSGSESGAGSESGSGSEAGAGQEPGTGSAGESGEKPGAGSGSGSDREPGASETGGDSDE